MRPGRTAFTRMFLPAYSARRAREVVHRGLRRGVARIGDAEEAQRGDRGDVDDGAAALALHDRDHVLHGEVAALEVDREDAVPGLLGELDHAADLDGADIVVEHVDAPVPLEAGLDRALDIRRARGVRPPGLGLAALAADDLRRLARGVLVHVDAEDPRAGAG